MKLNALICENTQVADFSALRGMNLKELWFTPRNITQGMDAVRQMKSLNGIGTGNNKFPAEEFWKRYDAGEFSK
jgi:hypothetical protein